MNWARKSHLYISNESKTLKQKKMKESRKQNLIKEYQKSTKKPSSTRLPSTTSTNFRPTRNGKRNTEPHDTDQFDGADARMRIAVHAFPCYIMMTRSTLDSSGQPIHPGVHGTTEAVHEYTQQLLQTNKHYQHVDVPPGRGRIARCTGIIVQINSSSMR